MGMLGFSKAVGSKGYKTAASATAITHDIDPLAGGRIAVHAFGATASESADSIYFMKSLGQTTVNGAVASGATTVVLTADPEPAGAAIAANDVVVIKMDDGSYHWTTVSSWTASTLTMVISDALDDTLADNQPVWCLGVSTDNGHDRFQLTASTQSTKEVDAGLFFGAGRNSPMRIHHANAGSVPGSIDYVSYSYLNK